MRTFEVVAGQPARWSGMTNPEAVVVQFLATVRVTGDPDGAGAVMAPVVACHQVVSEHPVTIQRSPQQYAEHVREMLAGLSEVTFTVEDLIAADDRVYVRWRQVGTHTAVLGGHQPSGRQLVEVGSAVYRVLGGRITEYWVQLDQAGLGAQLRGNAEPSPLGGAMVGAEGPTPRGQA